MPDTEANQMSATRNVPVIIDDDTTASEASSDELPETTTSHIKRKRQDVDVWADEPDHLEEYKEKEKEVKRQRRSGGQAKGRGKGNGPAQPAPKPRARGDQRGALGEDGRDSLLVPSHIANRRAKLELTEGGLKLPPNYDDLYFSDDERDVAELEERPKFNTIKPSRKYDDIPLEGSAGLIPASIAQYLRDYQIEGVRFLHEHFVFQTGAILGDDMGLGKTIQVAAFLTAAFGKTGDERDGKRLQNMRRDPNQRWYPIVLIICPISLIANWKSELDRWGWWKISIYHGKDKEDALRAARSRSVEIVLTTYTTYEMNQDKVNMVEWDVVVADEFHTVKDPKAKVTQAMASINSLCRIGLTGTAIQNKYEEFWTLLNWTNPGQFGSIHDWKVGIVTPLTRGQSHDATMQELSLARKTARRLVQNLLPQFFLRRMKSLIAHQLPKKTDKVVFCPLTSVQKDAYKRLLESDEVQSLLKSSEPCGCGSKNKYGWCCGKVLPDGRPWKGLVFPCIFALQKLSNHLTMLIPTDEAKAHDRNKWQNSLSLFQQAYPTGWKKVYDERMQVQALADPKFCGKWKILKELLDLWYSNKDKVLVFSHSVRLLHILESLFKKTSYSVSFLSGGTAMEDRQKEVDDFNSDPDKFVFLISTKAGGVGLNITSANKVVIFDPHWNPAYDLQAQDRAYRIGQTRDVEVFRLVAAGTIEEIVYARQIYKQQQANIGYNASTERRYFKGIQQDPDRKGEIFGLKNMFSFHGDQVVLQGIVNKTNVAEERASMRVVEVDMEAIAEDDDLKHITVKKEDSGDDGGLSQLAALITAEDPDELIKKSKSNKGKADAVQAILQKAGVQYTHENSEVVGSSKVEAQLSRKAEMAEPVDFGDSAGETALFGGNEMDDVLSEADSDTVLEPEFHPPEDVKIRQFCSMAREFGFESAQEFAFHVENMTQEQRRDKLQEFYKRRTLMLIEEQVEKHEGMDVKSVSHLKVEARPSRHAEFKAESDEETKHESKGFPVKPHTMVKTERSIKQETELEQVKIKKEPGVATMPKPIARIADIFIDDDDDDEF